MFIVAICQRLFKRYGYGTPSQSYGTSLAMWDHTVLPATRHKWTRPAFNPSHAGWYSIYLPRRDGRLSWPSWLDGAPGRESNQQPSDHESDAEPPHHQKTQNLQPYLCGRLCDARTERWLSFNDCLMTNKWLIDWLTDWLTIGRLGSDVTGRRRRQRKRL